MSEQIRKFMRRSPETVSPHLRVGEALRRVDDGEHLLVTDCDNLVGIVCRCDLERARPGLPVSACMSAPVLTISANMTVEEAAKLMRERGYGALPVTAGNVLLGMLTRADLARAGFSREFSRDHCSACGSSEHLRPQRCTVGTTFCADCLEQSDESIAECEVGAGD